MITLKDVFYKRDTKNILYDINLNIDNVDITIITGHNGAGKNIFKIMSGIINQQVELYIQKSIYYQTQVLYFKSLFFSEDQLKKILVMYFMLKINLTLKVS